MAPLPKILFVLTSHSKLGDTGKPTGWYLPEFAHPYKELAPVATITVASPKGGAAPLDPSSIDKKDAAGMQFLDTKQALWEQTEVLSTFKGRADEFAAIFFVGGHGPMFDLATDEDSQAIVREFWEKGKVVAAVCHGPAALCNVTLEGGKHLLDGQAVTGFSTVEEDQVQLTSAMPFVLEDALQKQSGGKFEKAAEPWGVKVVTAGGGRLLTGQNPASAGPIGVAVRNAIGAA